MKNKELKQLTVQELARREAELRQEIITLRVQQASGQLENPARLTLVRRAVARTQTLLTAHRHAAVAK